MKDIVLNDILCRKSTSDGDAVVGMCEKDEELWLSVAARWKIAMVFAHYKVIHTLKLKVFEIQKINLKTEQEIH